MPNSYPNKLGKPIQGYDMEKKTEKKTGMGIKNKNITNLVTKIRKF